MISGDDLDELEIHYQLCLPENFRKFMLNFPDELNEVFPVPQFYSRSMNYLVEMISDSFFINNKEGLIEVNDLARYEITNIRWIKDEPYWPNNLFIIGVDKNGDYFTIDTDVNQTYVWRYTRKSGVIRLEANSLDYFKDKVLTDVTNIKERICIIKRN